jgi:hypothetical protein
MAAKFVRKQADIRRGATAIGKRADRKVLGENVLRIRRANRADAASH